MLEQHVLLGFSFYASHLFWSMSDLKVPQLFLFILNISYPLAVKTDLLQNKLVFALRQSNPKRNDCCCENQNTWSCSSVFLFSSLKLSVLDCEQPASSSAFPAARTCSETIILHLLSQCLPLRCDFYKSNIVLSLQEKQQQ